MDDEIFEAEFVDAGESGDAELERRSDRTDTELSVHTQKLFDAAWAYRAKARSGATRRAYDQDWRAWLKFCEAHGFGPLPANPMHLVAWLGQMMSEELSPATLTRRLAGIRHFHDMKSLLDPTSHREVREILSGYRREVDFGTGDAAPISQEMLHQVVDAVDAQKLKGLRDRALLLAGWYGCFRRSELAGLALRHVTRMEGGYSVRLTLSKTGELTKGIPYRGDAHCPVGAMVEWMREGGVSSGSIFRVVGRWGHVRDHAMEGKDVARVLKSALLNAGFDPTEFSAHSLRAGAATAAAQQGASVYQLKLLGGWATAAMPVHYAKVGAVLDHHPFRR